MSVIDYSKSVIESLMKDDSLLKSYKFHITNDINSIDTSKIEVGDVFGILDEYNIILGEDNIIKDYFVYSGDDNFILIATSEDLKDNFEKDELDKCNEDELDKYPEKCNEE